MVDLKLAKTERSKFVREFLRKHEIEGFIYYICGKGEFNTIFKEEEKRNIKFYIEDNEANEERFGRQLKQKKVIKDLRELKQNSPILKDFQNECIKRHIIINLHIE